MAVKTTGRKMKKREGQRGGGEREELGEEGRRKKRWMGEKEEGIKADISWYSE